MRNIFTVHPSTVNETYALHFHFAYRIGVKLVFAGLACIVHSVFPFVFKSTASRTVQEINELMEIRNSKRIVQE